MAAYYDAKDRYDELCEWYDGYYFGKTEIFNPWSVINYFRSDCRPGAYWQSTGNNEIIGEVLSEAGPDIYERLQLLLQGKSFLTYIDTDVIYPEIKKNPSSVYSFLLVAGYLKVVKANSTFTNGFMCEVALPNKEISFVYKKEILDQLTGVVPQAAAISIQEALFEGDPVRLKEQMRRFLLETVSYSDTSEESFYHGLVLGMCAMMESQYYIRSDRESGEGRFDIQLMPKTRTLPGILIKIKAARAGTETDLRALAETAVRQIRDKQYETELRSHGVEEILRYGAAFRGKEAEIVVG